MPKRVADYEIQKGVPMPDPVYSGGQGRGVRKYPFLDMKVKDCFIYPRSECKAVSSAISKLKATHPHLTFATRTLDPTTCGCWRIKA